MKRLGLMILLITISLNAHALCVHEKWLTGAEIESLKIHQQLFVLSDDERFLDASQTELISTVNYFVQYEDESTELFEHQKENLDSYNQNYVEYYLPSHLDNYLKNNQQTFNSSNYKLENIGKSLQGRPLYALYPQNFNSTKPTLIMFGRHHGDEGSANWIIEGFLNWYFSNNKSEEFQLILYPMVNPDGAVARTRYNNKSRDLNRVWAKTPDQSLDEVGIIHRHFQKYLDAKTNIFLTLDMHGSFTEDFIYRVTKNFRDEAFFKRQGAYIEELGKYDPWQNGNFQLSDGHPQMSRILLVRDYGLNSLTHESIRNVPLSSGRSVETLKSQGLAVGQAIDELYFQ